MQRLRLGLVALVACAGSAAIALAVAGGDQGPSVQSAQTPFAGALRPPDVPAADFALRDEHGRRVALAAYRGRVVVLTFLYTTCRDTCPLMADQVRGAIDILGRPVPALAISVDPANDTRARAQAFLRRHRLSGRMRFLLGSRRELAPVWRAYGIAPQTHEHEHSAYVVVVDRRGRQRIGFPASQLTPEGLAHDIRLLSRSDV